MTRLEPGDQAPSFSLPDAEGGTVSLDDFRGKHLIVYFYPAAMTPGCTTQACDFRDHYEDLLAAGYAVVGISPDKPATLARFAERDSVPFPLLSDPDKQVLTAYGAFGEKKLYGKTVTGVIRSTLVIGPDQSVEWAKYNLRATGHVAMLLKQLPVG